MGNLEHRIPGISNNITCGIYKSPLGIVYLFADEHALCMLSYDNKVARETARECIIKDLTSPVEQAINFLDHYFNGEQAKIPPLYFLGYSQKEVAIYKNLLKVSFGNTISYSELARRSGFPKAARFAGSTMAKNRFPIIIPCHRVIKADGTIGNYTGGVEIKQFLLRHECAFRY